METIIDWLQFTIIDEKYSFEKVIEEVLGMDVSNFIELASGKLGYKKQLFYDNISILYNGNVGMGVHVIITGKGCRYYEKNNNLIELIKRINQAKGKLTRIDIAMDDYDGDVLLFDNLRTDIIRGNIISKWRDSTEIIKRTTEEGEIIGHTINVGSGASRIYMRLYNKGLEQNVNKMWIRLELEIKKEYAEKMQTLVTTEEIGPLVSKILNNYIRVVEKDGNKNKSRYKTKEYWLNIVNTIEKQKLTSRAEEKTIQDTKDWISKQVSTSLALITMYDEGNIDFIIHEIIEGKKKLKPKHLKKLRGNTSEQNNFDR